MMEVKDLMIGDWVMYRGEPIIVYEIDDYYNRINTEPDGYNAITCVEISEVTPIPITTQILEKNGFVKNRYGEIELNDELGTSEIYLVLEPTYSEEYYWWRINNNLIVKIKSVHELQHIMKLVGIEKEIKL